MAPNRSSRNTVECRCSVCKNKLGGFNIISSQTFKRHMRIEETKKNLLSHRIFNEDRIEMIHETSEAVDKHEQFFDAEEYEIENEGEFDEAAPAQTRNLPFSEADTMFGVDGDDCVHESISENEEDEEESEDSDDEAAIFGEELYELIFIFYTKDFSLDPQPKLNFIHRFIVTTIALFVSLYVVDEGAVILIAIINKILEIFQDPFRLPLSVPGLKQLAGYGNLTSGIKKYVACSECHTIYDIGVSVPLSCTSIKFGGSSLCSNPLFKSGSESRIPKRTYVYHSVIDSLKKFFRRPGFEDAINSWNRGPKVDGVLFDIYDGIMWNEFQDIDGFPFVDTDRSLMLTLNIDWFQPFDGVTYSCGAIYLAINNLPREIRFKKENTILVGLMPGPKEAKTSEINSYLQPLVDELQSLYKGVKIQTHQCPNGTTIRAALFMVACDIPAARKVCGFTSHTSTNACHKCKRQFSRLAGTSSVNYSGFDFSKWLLRTKNDNCKDAEVWRNATTKTERHRLEVENGVRWSELHRLEYFDAVRCTIIDPMHNLFLGTAKRMMEKWVADGIIDSKKLVSMQNMVKNMVLPPDYTPLKTKIAKGFPFMKADEWKSWCLVYSPVVLKDLLPPKMFENWIFFVNACRLLIKPNITEDEIDNAHEYLQKFCQGCENLYDLDLLSPNMHLHLHLHQTVQDFGPVYGYWLFGFERYNGILKNIQTNRKTGFEWTYMKRFVEEVHKEDFARNILESANAHGYLDIFKKLLKTETRSVIPPSQPHAFSLSDFINAAYNTTSSIKGNESLPPSAFPLRTKPLSPMPSPDYDCLVEHYQVVYNDRSISSCKINMDSSAFVNDWIVMLKSINILGQVFKGNHGNKRGSYIQALFVEDKTNVIYGYIGEIQYIFVHTFSPASLSTEYHNPQHTFAFVKWYKTTSDRTREMEGIEIHKSEFSRVDFQSILPMHRILMPVAIVDYQPLSKISKKLVVPLPRKIYT
ncbi:hypothetical protein INT47_003105 [Mucor saturninus]|uniref:Transposase domain-containing protein n=1 Tax=Mucor saturninus TaxID=64648 RepID=A0A8H7QHC2_9FUNG|nr:hypothetical protein INT47_003105 [Mucor saturninus]